jgi:hypothetical protein
MNFLDYLELFICSSGFFIAIIRISEPYVLSNFKKSLKNLGLIIFKEYDEYE